MHWLRAWFLELQLDRLLLGGLITAIITLLLAELTRSLRVKRLLLRTATLPLITLRVKNGTVEVSILGDYRVVNMSDLPGFIERISIHGYNSASRAFQFRVSPIRQPFGKLGFEEVKVPRHDEATIASPEASEVHLERYDVLWAPFFIWLETLEVVRIGQRGRWRWRAYLYKPKWYRPETGQITYRPVGLEVSFALARYLALPGKWIYWLMAKRRQQRLRASL